MKSAEEIKGNAGSFRSDRGRCVMPPSWRRVRITPIRSRRQTTVLSAAERLLTKETRALPWARRPEATAVVAQFADRIEGGKRSLPGNPAAAPPAPRPGGHCHAPRGGSRSEPWMWQGRCQRELDNVPADADRPVQQARYSNPRPLRRSWAAVRTHSKLRRWASAGPASVVRLERHRRLGQLE